MSAVPGPRKGGPAPSSVPTPIAKDDPTTAEVTSDDAIYVPRSTKRRTRAEIEVIRGGIYTILSQQNPMTLRGLFYQLVSTGLIAKTETEYKATVGRLVTDMRRDKTIPWSWLADSTRWMRKRITWDSMEEALRVTAEAYRRSLWTDAPDYVEVWIEKDAIAGVIFDVTDEWDVPLMPTRGYASLSFLSTAAETFTHKAKRGKSVYLYYLGDHDPSGVDIPRKVESSIREMAPTVDLHFERLAVNEEQIELYNLPTRPTKTTDTRSKTFTGESVEVDAIPADTLRSIVSNAIVRHVDDHALRLLLAYEEDERAQLTRIANIIGGRS